MRILPKLRRKRSSSLKKSPESSGTEITSPEAETITYRKINIFYADDISDNVKAVLSSIERAGLIDNRDKKKNQLELIIPDSESNYGKNKAILQGTDCLIHFDYSTKIDDSINKIKTHRFGFDLVVADLYFGENDLKYRDSKVGGIWILFWAMMKSNSRKTICKLYSGHIESVKEHIDFINAERYLENAYKIKIDRIEKSRDAKGWKEYLQEYIKQVRVNLLQEIKMDDRVNFINYLENNLKREYFSNALADSNLDSFRKKLAKLGDWEFNLHDSERIKLIHLFPFLLGGHFISRGKRNFNNMASQKLETSLYTDELNFNSWEKRDQVVKEFEIENKKIETFRKHDLLGRPVYGIKLLDKDNDFGLIAKIKESFIQSLDCSYQVHEFYTKQNGFRHWSSSSQNSQIGEKEFENIRLNSIKPGFKKIEACFDHHIPYDNEHGPKLNEQIKETIENIKESYFWEKDKSKQAMEHSYSKFDKYRLYDAATKKTIVPLKALFRLDVKMYLKSSLNVVEGSDYRNMEDDEYVKLSDNKLYWYCNAYLIRLGLKNIKDNMTSKKPIFYILEMADQKDKAIIKYKIILRDKLNGLPSIAQQFNSPDDKIFKFDEYMRGFCQITIKSKLRDFPAICYDVYSDTKDWECGSMNDVGTIYEIMFTQGRNR